MSGIGSKIVAIQIYYENVREGMSLPILQKLPTVRQLVMYAGASGDYCEIHYDHQFAQSAGLPTVIVHGALKNAFLGQLLTDWIGNDGSIKKMSVQYRDMDGTNSPIYCKGIVTKKYTKGSEYLVECAIWTEKITGEKTTLGTALLSLPSVTTQPYGQ